MVHNTFADIYYKPENSALEKCDYDDYVFKKCKGNNISLILIK